MTFLEDIELRRLTLPDDLGLEPVGLALGQGPHALEIAIAESVQRPTAELMRRAWRARLAGRVVPLLLVVLYENRAALCGPSGQEPPVYSELEVAQVERICRAALGEVDRHAALRLLQSVLPEVESALPGLRNEGLLATHELQQGVTRRTDWVEAGNQGRAVLSRSGDALLRTLGYEVVALDGPVSALVARGTKIAIAVLLNQSESIDMASERFSGTSPIAFALARADRERLPYVIVVVGRRLRLYPVEAGVGVGRRGRTETFVEVSLDLLPEALAAYLWLLFSADALSPNGSFEEILLRSGDYAADLSTRLRERIYAEVVPLLARSIVDARDLDAPGPSELATTYQMALTVLFRLLFIAYAEDQELLPYRTNSLYKTRSLKQKARELLQFVESGAAFGRESFHWDEARRLFVAVDRGRPEWGIPVYDGGLFSSDPEQYPVNAELDRLSLRDEYFGAALAELLLDQSPEGLGPVDFRSLGVREFGTIYEGLLESELSVAEIDLTVDADQIYVPASNEDQVLVRRGEIYLHNSSGARKATGSYYTKSFAVEHLLDQALEPALAEHLERLEALNDERQAAKAFFDFRVADISMGSGHFLVAAIDRIERRLATYLANRPLPGVIDELARLRDRALEAIESVSGTVQIDDTQLLRRQVARRCIYGVDLNPMAVELARLSIWIHTFVPGLPLSLLDYNLVVGNSLVGIATLDEAAELLGAGGGTLFAMSAEQLLGAARETLEQLGQLADSDAAEIARAREAYREAREALRPAEALLDILAASRLNGELATIITTGAATHWVQDPASVLGSSAHIEAQTILTEISPFHFPVAFSQVFLRDRPGFDVILGNPPWEEATLEEDRFWTRYSPGLQSLTQRQQEARKTQLRTERPDLYQSYLEELERVTAFRRVLTSGPYPGMGTGDADLYKAFGWRFWSLACRPNGRIGVVLPRSALSVKGSELFRRKILTDGQIEDLTTLINNRQWIFDNVHPQYTIALLTVQKKAPQDQAYIPIRGPFRSLERFFAGVQQQSIRFAVNEVLSWTDTAALPLLPTEESVAVFAQLRLSPRVDTNDGQSWRARPHRELDATNDRGLMDLVSETCPDGFWPVFKGESFDVWEADTGSYFAWVNPDDLLQELQARRTRGGRLARSAFSEFDQAWINNPDAQPCLFPRIAFRDVSRATDTRTVKVALVPPNIAITNTAPYLLWPRGDELDQAYLLGVLSSIPFDWYARRFVETHLNYHVFNPFPVPRPTRDNRLWQRVVALAGRLAAVDHRFADWALAVGVEVGSLDAREKENMIAELDAVVAHLYELSENQLCHIFETFHVGWNFGARLEAARNHYAAWAGAQ